MQPSFPLFSSPRAIIVLSGETESGSAGEQPDIPERALAVKGRPWNFLR